MNESERWVEFGAYLREQRDKVGLSRREAARRSKVPESVWKDLEKGAKNSYGGVRVLPNPGADVLEKMADVLEVTPEELSRHVGRPRRAKSSATSTAVNSTSPLAQKVARLSERDRKAVEALVDQLLELDLE